jgi:hypothetical protein
MPGAFPDFKDKKHVGPIVCAAATLFAGSLFSLFARTGASGAQPLPQTALRHG